MLKNCFTIRVDMDDTIEYLLEAWVQWLNAKYSLDVRYESIREWDMTQNFPTLTEKQIYEPLELDDFWTTVQPMKDAVLLLKRLIEDDKQDVYVVTSPGNFKSIVPKIENVLHKHFSFIKDDHIVITKDKSLVIADIAIDDNINNLCLYNTPTPFIRILMDCPHNRKVDIDALSTNLGISIIRAHSWFTIHTLIQGIDLAYSALNAQTVAH